MFRPKKPPNLRDHSNLPIRMSLSQRLRNLRNPETMAQQDLSQVSLADLEQEIVKFGTKHVGKSFKQAWLDQDWVQFMLTRYGQNPCPQHRRFFRYVELMIEHHEQNQMPIVTSNHTRSGTPAYHPMTPGAAFPKSKAMAKAKAGYAPRMEEVHSSPPIEADEEEWDLDTMTYQWDSMTAPNESNNSEVHAMGQRILQMENALQQVIHHLGNQSASQNIEEVP